MDLLVTHLDILKQQGLINLWDDMRIHLNKNWHQEIKKAIDTASVAILLVSPNFLTSEYLLHEEIPFLLEHRYKEGLHIIPIITMPCVWNSVNWLAKMQIFPGDGRPISTGDEIQIDRDFATITNEVYKLLKEEGVIPFTTKVFAPSCTKVSISRLPETGLELIGRKQELSLLNEAWDDPKTNIISLIGLGGVGKSALANVWLNQMREANYRGAERVYGWSFYSQGALVEKLASADLFIAETLRWFGDATPYLGSSWDKAERLAELIQSKPTLLIIDGLESLQRFTEAQEGRLKDVALRTLLMSLARRSSGLCIITSRLPVSDLDNYIGTSVKQIKLQQLSPEAGAQLLYNLGVKGNYEDLILASQEFGGHALSLILLGRYLATTYNGDVMKRETINVQSYEGVQKRDIVSLLELYISQLKGEAELEILQILSLFDGTAEKDALQALSARPAIKGLTFVLSNLAPEEWKKPIANLRERSLIEKPDLHEPDTLYCHPLIRDYFRRKIQNEYPESFREAHGRLYEYYKLSAREYPEMIEEMQSLYSAVFHGSQAGRHQEVFREVYWRRILRGNESYLTIKLGAYSEDLSLLSYFFERPWYKPTESLTEEEKAFVLNRAGFDLRALGRLSEAVEPLKAGMEADLERANWSNASRANLNLSELTLILGNLSEALHYANYSMDLADRTGDTFLRIAARTSIANTLYHFGHIEEAKQHFEEAEAQQKEIQPDFPLLYSIQGFKYCDFLLSLEKYQEVIERSEQTLEWAKKSGGNLLTLSLDHLTLGRAYFLKAQKEGLDDFSLAKDNLDRAVKGMRQTGVHQELALCLIAQAELSRILCKVESARRNLYEALSLATQGGMGLLLVDIHLELARLYIFMDMNNIAKENLSTARKLIKARSYYRRKKELTKLEELI